MAKTEFKDYMMDLARPNANKQQVNSAPDSNKAEKSAPKKAPKKEAGEKKGNVKTDSSETDSKKNLSEQKKEPAPEKEIAATNEKDKVAEVSQKRAAKELNEARASLVMPANLFKKAEMAALMRFKGNLSAYVRTLIEDDLKQNEDAYQKFFEAYESFRS